MKVIEITKQTEIDPDSGFGFNHDLIKKVEEHNKWMRDNGVRRFPTIAPNVHMMHQVPQVDKREETGSC
jgi:uncharacterized protein related to proFAR isomerase